MIRSTDQEMTATEKLVWYSQFPRGRGMASLLAKSHGGAPEAIRGHVGKAFIVG